MKTASRDNFSAFILFFVVVVSDEEVIGRRFGTILATAIKCGRQQHLVHTSTRIKCPLPHRQRCDVKASMDTLFTDQAMQKPSIHYAQQ